MLWNKIKERSIISYVRRLQYNKCSFSNLRSLMLFLFSHICGQGALALGQIKRERNQEMLVKVREHEPQAIVEVVLVPT